MFVCQMITQTLAVKLPFIIAIKEATGLIPFFMDL